MKSHHKILFALALLLVPFAALGQVDDSEIILFYSVRHEDSTPPGGVLLSVPLTDTPLQTIPLPPQLFPTGSIIRDVALSPDHRYLAVTSQTAGDLANPVAILDLQSNRCCVYVRPSLEDVAAYALGGFSPDSERLVLSWVAENFDSVARRFPGGMVVVGAATGTPLQNITMEEIGAALGSKYEGSWALLGDWREDGIRFYPNCYACEPEFQGEWAVWTPETNTLTATDEYFNLYGLDVLAGTSETLFAVFDARFPNCACGPDYWPIPNVIEYVPPSGSTQSDAAVIFFSERHQQLDRAFWVLDGQAALVIPINENEGEWTLLFRDGTRQSVFVPPESEFLAGTPDGWLALLDGADGADLTLYTVDGAEVVGLSLGTTIPSSAHVQVLDAPELGTNIASVGAFPTVEPPLSETPES
jgi:hypothetical protein